MNRVLVAVIALAAMLVVGVVPASATCHRSNPSITITSPDGFGFCCTHPSTHSVAVTNVGTGTTGKLAVTLAGQGAENFAVTNDHCTGRSLRAGRTCRFDLTWLPNVDSFPTLTVASKRVVATQDVSGVAVP